MAKKKGCLGCFALAVVAVAGGFFAFRSMIAPVPVGAKRYVRFDKTVELGPALARLEKEGLLRSSLATGLYAKLKRKEAKVREGTYSLSPGLTADQLLAELQNPVRQMVRLPETNWAARSANLLERAQVCTAEEYMDLFRKPQEFQSEVGFPLPADGTLEGYLYPDTYDLPPLLGAREVILRQLRTFEKRILKGGSPPDNLRRALIIASMVELEVARHEERPIVAGVIENRLKLGMPLQIDAALLYGIQEWRALTFDDYRNIDSPYNVYRHKGLPPGPICSPTDKSYRAALNPAKHEYLYYVALPEGRHLFSKTYGEHLRNIGKRKAAIAATEKAKAQ
jgi:UPF0755 protein